MARGKNSAALFEVIQAAKQKEQLRASGGGFLTPSWWFKSKNRNATLPPATNKAEALARAAKPRPASGPAAALNNPLFYSESPKPKTAPPPVVEEESTDAIAEQTSVEEPITEQAGTEETEAPIAIPVSDVVDNEVPAMADAKPEPVVRSSFSTARAITTETGPEPIVAAEPSIVAHKPAGRRGVDLDVDRTNQRINLRFTYTSAAITSFGFIVVIMLTIIVTKTISHGPSQANASIETLKNGKVFPDVLKVPPAKGGSGDNLAQPVSGRIKAAQPIPAPNSGKATPTVPKILQPAPPLNPVPPAVPGTSSGLSANGKRIVGMQYVWIQSCADPLDAKDEVEALKKVGIDATAETGTRLAPSWTCVIGTRGFDHVKGNPEFDAYMKSIDDAGRAFAATYKFAHFRPTVIGWKEPGH